MVARLHSLLGLVPLAVFAIFHVWDLWPILEARDSWLASRREGGRLAVAALVLLPLVAHGVLGIVRVGRRGAARGVDAARRGLARVQLGTGVMMLVFVAFHLAQVWGDVPGPHRAPGAGYARLWGELGRPVPLLLYLLGVTSLSFHLGHGISRLPETWGREPTAGARLLSRLLGGVFGFALWLALLQLLAHFAVGGPLLGDGSAASELLRR
jgi:succinate dehydrogenase/fumarate reductase cytochrome b subunit